MSPSTHEDPVTGEQREHDGAASGRLSIARQLGPGVGAAVIGWVVAIAAAHLALAEMPLGAAPELLLNAPPLHGVIDVRIDAGLMMPMFVGGVLIAFGPAVAARASWPWLLVGATAAAASWAVALALVDGSDGLLRGVLGHTEYLADVPIVRDVGELLSAYPELVRTRGLAAHSSGHPPGVLLALVGLDRLGFGGPEPAAGLFIAGGAAAVPAVLVAAREVVGEAFARRAVLFVVLAPIALWVATSADALFAGVSAWSAAAVVLATGRTGRRSIVLALSGGVGFGISIFLSYGLALVALVPVAAAIARRRPAPIAWAAVGALPITIAFWIAGFFWFDGFAATRDRYLAGISVHRPYLVFLVVNLVVLALTLGPVGSYSLARLRGRAPWLLVGGAAAAIAIADLTGMSKAEVERIWVPFAIWLLLAGGALRATPGALRALLGIQVLATLVIGATVMTAW